MTGPARRLRDQAGQVTIFVVVMFIALVAVAGLVIDGGRALAARRRSIDEAEAAARAGAQALSVDAYRSSATITLDPAAARAAAVSYLAATGDTGQVTIAGGTITVTVETHQTMTILGIVGIRTMTLAGTGSAELVRGVQGPE